MTAAVTGVANVVVEAPRPKRDEEFTAKENARDLSTKEMWENIELLMKGSSLNEQRKQEELFDKYERFCAIGNKSIHELRKAYNPHALKTLKKQEQSSSGVEPLAYLAHSLKHQTSTIVASPTSTSSSILALKQQAQSGSDAMMATMQWLVNLLSSFQKQFPPTNNQLRTSSNPRSHATVHEGQIVTKTVQRKAPGNVSNAGTKRNQGYRNKTNRNGKKVICYNCHSEGHVAKECKEPKRAKDTQYYKDKMMLSDAKDRGVILDAEAKAFLADVECTEPYNESLALTTTTAFQVSHEDAYNSDIDDGPHAVAAFMNLSSTEEVNGTSLSKINEAIVERNKWNDELEQENSLLKTTLFNKEESIKALNEKNKKVVFEKKDLDERNLEEIVCLQKANKVMSDLLKTYQQTTQTIPMLSKRPNIATSDLHKTALGSSNLKYGNIARESHPAIYDGNRLLEPTHVPSSVWEIEETIALGVESRAKMFEKPGTVKPINYDVLNNSYIKFVPQKELSRKHVYWQLASAVKALFVHTHPAKKVLVKEVKEFENIFDELDDEYEQGVKKIKSLKITNRNLMCEIECLTSDSIANDVCAIVCTADVRMPLDAEISSSCVRELSKGLELEAEIAKENKMLFESKK
uniref:CCHC-type domain-containing protein n=1 Tax=Tanacetum cinerariifolium TaxID=118510 RepID=A0A699GY35_TANCI|nr:hypothetical protein [Tanacetum cinerariifolium]